MLKLPPIASTGVTSPTARSTGERRPGSCSQGVEGDWQRRRGRVASAPPLPPGSPRTELGLRRGCRSTVHMGLHLLGLHPRALLGEQLWALTRGPWLTSGGRVGQRKTQEGASGFDRDVQSCSYTCVLDAQDSKMTQTWSCLKDPTQNTVISLVMIMKEKYSRHLWPGRGAAPCPDQPFTSQPVGSGS